MEELKIAGTPETPEVILNSETFAISGNSYPEDTSAFYLPVIKWMRKYSENPSEKTEFNFKFIYFNSASYKSIYEIILVLDEIHKKGFEVKVNWFYKDGDTDIKEVGEEFAHVVKIPFSFSAL